MNPMIKSFDIIEKVLSSSPNNEIKIHDFNELHQLSKLNNKFSSFFKNIRKEASSLTNKIFRTKDFFQTPSSKDKSLNFNKIYEDKFELNKALKMKENEFYFIDHPHFGIILRISMWKSKKD